MSTNAAAGRSTRMTPHQNSYNDTRRLQESALGKESGYGDEELSIVASDEDASSQDSSHGLMRASKENSNGAKAPVDLVRKETYYVNILRYAVVILLVGSGILFSVGAFVTAADAYGDGSVDAVCRLQDDLQFSDFVYAVTSSLTDAWTARLTAAFTISAAITSHSLVDSGGGWPLVFVPHLGAQTSGILQGLAGTDRIVFAPLVSSFVTQEFEDFAGTRQQQECQFANCKIRNVDGTAATGKANGNNVNNILGLVLQTSPGFLGGTQESFLLVDLFSDPVQGPALTRMVNSKAAIFSELVDESLTSPDQTLVESSSTNITSDTNETLAMGPTTTLFYPIFEDFSQGRVVGSLSMDITWRELLEKSLPFELGGATMVLENSCQSGMMLVFTVNEKGTLEYTGPLESSVDFAKENGVVLPSGYDYGIFDEALSSNNCEYIVHLLEHPLDNASLASDDSGEGSARPAIYTAVVAVTYFILLVIFLIYDWLVERRQSVVINIATKSSAIVENLFPAQVRDRMLQNIGENKQKVADEGKGGPSQDPSDPSAAAPGTGTTTSGKPAAADTAVSVKQFLTNMPENSNDLSSQPIADLFSNTTVLFADIAGFTAWSSQREPPQVFTLLETLYRSFDVIAGKLKVFKVETIGDCYMAGADTGKLCFLKYNSTYHMNFVHLTFHLCLDLLFRP